jgi:hypothetical protein
MSLDTVIDSSSERHIMKSNHPSATPKFKTFLFAMSMLVAGTASAAVTGYVANPTGNSVDWGNAVTSLGATINTSVDFNAAGLTTSNMGTFYAPAVSVSASNITVANSTSGNGSYSPLGGDWVRSSGEGDWASSKLLLANSSVGFSGNPPQSVTFTFQSGVFGAGVFLVDYLGIDQWTITARDVNNNPLGSPLQSILHTSFQRNQSPDDGTIHKYFLGISSTEANIASFTISRPGTGMFQGGDIVGLDDFRFAVAAPPVPEPSEWAMLVAGLAVVGFIARRRKSMS